MKWFEVKVRSCNTGGLNWESTVRAETEEEVEEWAYSQADEDEWVEIRELHPSEID